MSTRTRLTSRKFHAINRDLKMHGKVKDVAAIHGVSEESVRTVKRAKTWPRFEAMKKLKNEQRRPSGITTAVKSAQALQDVGADLKALGDITRAPKNQIRPLPSEEVKVITVKDWEDLNSKLGRIYTLLAQRKGFFSFLLGRK